MRIGIFCLLLAFSSSVGAQTWSEWFQQKKTQRKYLLEQIAAFQTYVDYVKKGYGIARDGLNAIQHSKEGNLQLHTGYFESLKQVNPNVQHYSKVAAIIACQLQMIRKVRDATTGILDLGQFTADEVAYCKKVFGNLLAESLKNIEELMLLLTSGNLEMKDNERIVRIDALYIDMQEKYSFCASVSEEIALLAVQRMREAHDIDFSRKLNGLK